MDTSETYIKMCDCPEIQGNKHHSVFTHYKLDTGETIDVHGDYIAWVDIDVADYTPERPDKPIWLPRQDQLQEMVKSYYEQRSVNPFECDDFGLIEYFYNYWWIDNDDLEVPKSMEQLWLAFVMKEKYGKVWDERWH